MEESKTKSGWTFNSLLKSGVDYLLGSENAGEEEICKFYLEGKCRFGDECRKTHPTNVKVKVTKKVSKKAKEEPQNTKMKTAADVIKRIQWDSQLSPEFFRIGYLDRFEGLIEEPFEKFSNWGDLANADLDALAIPQHRIEYFKYRGEIVWNKKTRIDRVFGSGKAEKQDFVITMNQIDENIEKNKVKKVQLQDDCDSDFSDSDSEEGFNIQVKKVDSTEVANKVNFINDEDRSTHFIAVRITDPEIIENVRKVQTSIVEGEEILSECCMKLGLLHITINMIRIKNEFGAEEVVKILEKIKPELEEALKNGGQLKVSNLETFGARVLFAKVEENSEFAKLVAKINTALKETSDNVNITDKFEFTPHLTLCKVSRPISRMRNSKFLPSKLYENFTDLNFGVQPLNNLQLCVIEATTRHDGFYRTLCEIVN